MDWNYDGYLSIDEFITGLENLNNEIGMCQNLQFMTYFYEDLYDSEFRFWGQMEDYYDYGSGLEILDELLQTQDMRDVWF
jgi:hypothetical protein